MAEPWKPFLFLRRGRVWTIVYPAPDGRKMQKAIPGCGPDKEVAAKKVLARFTQRLEASRKLEGQDDDEGPLTFARLARMFMTGKSAKGLRSVGRYEQILTDHVLPHVGAKRADKVTDEDVAAVLAAVGHLAPRSQRHVFYTMNGVFKLGARKGLLDVNPCGRVAEEDLPKKIDAVIGWRRKAIFEQAELELLITSDIVPYDRRVFYAVLFLAGCRLSEVSALKVEHYDPGKRPLGQLAVEWSYDAEERAVGPTKTQNPRLVPVHPTLALILGPWLAEGWEQMMGRRPTADDILIPNRRNWYRARSQVWQSLNGRPAQPKRNRKAVAGDLERLGLRRRRVHDARRTLVSFCRRDGADKDTLRLATHGPEGDIVDIYTETAVMWPALCTELAKLKVGPLSVPGWSPQGRGLQDRAGTAAKPAESQGPRLPPGCHLENPQLVTGSYAVTPPGIEKHRGHGQPAAADDPQEQTAEFRGDRAPPHRTGGSSEAQPAPVATMATLALRQALAALDRGRLDEARAILERAVAAEQEASPAARRAR